MLLYYIIFIETFTKYYRTKIVQIVQLLHMQN